MKTLLIAEYRDGKLQDNYGELQGFASRLGAETVMFIAGSESALPACDGKLYLAPAEKYGEYNPDAHKQLIALVIETEQPDIIETGGWATEGAA